MARAKTELKDDAVLPTENDYIPEDVEFLQFVSEYDASQGGGIHVYREGPGGYRDLTFVKAFAFGEFEPPMLQQPPFNGGKFRVHVRSASGMLKNFPFKCEPANVPAVATERAAPVDHTGALLAGMLEGFKALSSQIAANAPKATSVEDQIKLFATLQGIAGANRPAEQVDQFAMIERVLNLQKQLQPEHVPTNENGETDTGAIILQAIKTFGEPLAEIVKSNAQNAATIRGQQFAPQTDRAAPVALPSLALVPLPVPNVATDEPMQTVDSPEDNEMNIKIAMVKPLLLASARAGLAVDTYTDVLLNTFSDEELHKYISAPEWKAEFLRLMPEASDCMGWFEALRADVLQAMQDEAGPDDPKGDALTA